MSRKHSLRFLVVLILAFVLNVLAETPKARRQKNTSSLNDLAQESTNSTLWLSPSDLKKHKIWPNGVIPYFIDLISYSDFQIVTKIKRFFNYINRITGVHFISLLSPPKDNETRFVVFTNRKRLLQCDDVDINKFTEQGAQNVVLGYECLGNGDLSRVALNILGVTPQHNSPDRDEHFSFQKDNVLPDKINLFTKVTPQDWLFSNIPYDFKSAGHYGYHHCSKNGRATLKPKNNIDFKLGEANFLSMTDIKKIKMIYGPLVKDNIGAEECKKMFITRGNIQEYKKQNEAPEKHDVVVDVRDLEDSPSKEKVKKKNVPPPNDYRGVLSKVGGTKKKVNIKHLKDHKTF